MPWSGLFKAAFDGPEVIYNEVFSTLNYEGVW
jgi:hypothetical protein